MDERSAKLLLKAVRSLPQREQDHLMAALVVEAFNEPWVGVRPGSPPDIALSYASQPAVPVPSMGAPGQSTMLPVRLPPELHGRLRVWCTDQGFSMAAVVRGLVERFLEEQAGTRPKRRPATRPVTPPAKRSPTRAKRPTARG